MLVFLNQNFFFFFFSPRAPSPPTTSPPLTRRAASTAHQSTRLLLRSDLVCVLWSVRGLGSGSSRCCSFTPSP